MINQHENVRNPLRPLARVPVAHARLLDRLARERQDRARRLLEISLDRERAVQLSAARRGEVKLAVPPSRPSWRRPGKLTAAALKQARQESGLSDRRLDAQLQRDIDVQQRMLREMVRAGQTRAKVGENTTLFVCGLMASAINVKAESFPGSHGSTTISSPIAIQRSTGRNRSRFFGTVFSPVELFGLALLQVTQTTRFAFSTSIGGALTASASLAPIGSYSIMAPSPAYVFPFWNAGAASFAAPDGNDHRHDEHAEFGRLDDDDNPARGGPDDHR
jgi:hypothetical protein